jgi:hypothetical protein
MKGFDGVYTDTYSSYGTENFDSMNTQIDINNNINQINEINTHLAANRASVQSNFADISNNLQKYYDNANYLSLNNSKYHYDDIQKSQEIVLQTSPKDIKYVIQDDINQLKLYQNSIYISGVIACATLLIAAILISKK